MKAKVIEKIFDRLLFYLTVPKCVCCEERLDADDKALCKSCLNSYRETKKAKCSVCLKLLCECTCPNQYLESHFVHKVTKVFRYRNSSEPGKLIPANELIYNVKRVARRDLVGFIADEMTQSLKNSFKTDKFIITSVPRSAGRVNKYGFDHSEKIARAIAVRLGIKYVRLLKSRLKNAQKKTKGEQRILNARFDYRKMRPDITGASVILVDDIVTTGASMGNSAALIKGLGAKQIIGACFAIAYKDNYKSFDSSYS